MAHLRTIGERLTLWLLRTAVMLALFAGLAVMLPTLTMSSFPTAGELVRMLARHAARFGAALAAGGVLGLYLVASRAKLFGGETLDSRTTPDLRGSARWLFALTLVAIPVLAILQLVPLASFWREVIQLLESLGPWDLGAGAQFSGVVLLPLFAILALPAFEVLTALVLGAGCALLLLLTAARSRLLTRATLVCVTLVGALAIAGLLAADTTRQVAPIVERMVRDPALKQGPETRQVLDAMARYLRVTGRASEVIAWAWTALMIWVPVLLLAARARLAELAAAASEPLAESGAVPFESVAPAAPDTPPATGPDRARFYERAARLVEGRGPGDPAGRPIVLSVMLAFGLIGLLVALSSLGAFAAFARVFMRQP